MWPLGVCSAPGCSLHLVTIVCASPWAELRVDDELNVGCKNNCSCVLGDRGGRGWGTGEREEGLGNMGDAGLPHLCFVQAILPACPGILTLFPRDTDYWITAQVAQAFHGYSVTTF